MEGRSGWLGGLGEAIMVRWVAVGAVWAGALGGPRAPGPLFLVDDTRTPHVVVSWPVVGGKTMTVEGDRAYADPSRRESLGHNLECYVAPGGTRQDVGASDPAGAMIRVGLYKTDARRPLFENMAADASVTVMLRGVAFNQPAAARPTSAVLHAKFDDPNSILGCAASAAASARNNLLDLYNTVDHTDTLGGRITARNGRLGSLDGSAAAPARGSVVFTTEADGSITMVATIPYALFKHPDDPWLRSNPGDFVEPFHFHIEYEALPTASPAALPAGAAEPAAAHRAGGGR